MKAGESVDTHDPLWHQEMSRLMALGKPFVVINWIARVDAPVSTELASEFDYSYTANAEERKAYFTKRISD